MHSDYRVQSPNVRYEWYRSHFMKLFRSVGLPHWIAPPTGAACPRSRLRARVHDWRANRCPILRRPDGMAKVELHLGELHGAAVKVRNEVASELPYAWSTLRCEMCFLLAPNAIANRAK